MLKPFLYIIFLTFLSVSSVHPQVNNNQQIPAVWDLKTAIEYAKQNNITINSLKLTRQTSEQNVIVTKAAKYPNLTGSVSEGVTNYKTGINISSGYGASSSLTLYNGGYLNNDIKEKQLTLQAAALDITTEENDITLQITEAYLNILLAGENIVYLKDLVATSQAQVTQAEQRFAAGTIAKKDLLQLEALLASDKYNVISTENTKRQYILTLKQLLQLPSEIDFDIAKADTVNGTALVAPLAEVQQKALQNRPEVKSSELGVQIAQTGIDKARAGLKPTLSLGGSIYTAYSTDPAYKYFSQLNNNLYQQVGLTLSIPLLDRKVTRTNVAKANIETRQANLTLQNTRLVLTQAIEQAYINVNNAQSQYKAAAEQLRYTEEAFRIANEQLKIGVYNTVEYLQQKNLYIQALQSFTQAKYTVAIYTKIYNFYAGVPVTQ